MTNTEAVTLPERLNILDSPQENALAVPDLQPRAVGEVSLSVVRVENGQTRLAGLRQSGSLKALFPRNTGGSDTCLAVLINTAGGITGGDCFATRAEAGPGARLTLTSQAAERAYRAMPGQTGRVRTTLKAAPGAHLNWLPQETLIFDGSAIDRHLNVNLAEDASALIVEPLVFGRAAMGETVRKACVKDRIEIRKNGKPLTIDQVCLSGDVATQLDRAAVGNGNCAMANLVFVHPTAEAHLATVRNMLPSTGGASLREENTLAVRLLAADSHILRQTLVPLLKLLSGEEIPRPWMI